MRWALLVALFAGVSWADSLPTETDRLVATGKLWITVKYFHPAMAYRDVDWDRVLLEALPKIRAAQTESDYEAAVQGMMRGLGGAPISGKGQRVWIHHGFAPEDGAVASPFYSGFLYKDGNAVEEVNVPMGGNGFVVKVPLSEPANAGEPIPSPAAIVPKIESDPYPSVEQRILAAYKIWGVLHYFFAYRDLLDEDWDVLFTQFLPRMMAAKDGLAYNLTIAEWLTHAADTFTAPESATLTQYFGEAPVGLRLRIVEKHVTVTEVLDPEATKAGVKVGDVVKKVDGETLVDRYKREEQYIPASTPQRLGADVVERILNGADDSSALLTMEDFAGNRKEVTLKRSKRFLTPLKELPAGDVVKVLRGGVGYVDLRRLKRDDVAGMFEKLQNAPAILFDMRGEAGDDEAYRMVAARLAPPADASDIAAEIVTGPIVSFPDVGAAQNGIASRSESYFFLKTIPNAGAASTKYKGKTVLLVDERTIRTGEEAGLYLEAANKTDVIGSPTAGAFSVYTRFVVPGGVTVSFSGEDVRHANGGKLQRLGLQPNVTLTPTLIGIRTGKDEVLEKGLESVLPKPPNPKTLPSRAARQP